MFFSTIVVSIHEFRDLFLNKIYSYDNEEYRNLDLDDLYIWIVQRTLNDYFEEKLKRTYFNTSHLNTLYNIIYDELKYTLLSEISPYLEDFYNQLIKQFSNTDIENMQLVVTNATFMLTLGVKDKYG